MNFTYSDYRNIVRKIKNAGYAAHHIDGNGYDGKCLYLRHDVDTDIFGVLPLAEAEHEEGVVSTWYFLPDCPIYNIFSEEVAKIIEKLVSLGHCVGLHVDGKRFSSTAQMQDALDGTLAYADAIGVKGLSRTFSFHRPAPWLLEQGIELGGGGQMLIQKSITGFLNALSMSLTATGGNSGKKSVWRPQSRMDATSHC